MRSINYRPDIDGLRAIAVVAVVLFHADITPFGGGFVGVDIFFVISGFLITSLILNEIDSATFSLFSFYERRVRRIVPAAVIVLTASTICAWFMLVAPPFYKFCESLLAAVLFSSNWYFLADTSYFAATASAKPLLHTWTLSIEEQFYLLFPLMMIGLSSNLRRSIVVSIALICSLGLAVYLTLTLSLDNLFFNSLSRFCEPLIGCLAAFVYRRFAIRPLASIALRAGGLVIMAYAIMTPTPVVGVVEMLVPCLGAAAFVLARPISLDPIHWIVSSSPFTWIGKLSYSIYLWHWPILVFAKIYFGSLTTNTQVAGCILLTLGFSVLTYYAVEKPVRSRTLFPIRRTAFRYSGFAALSITMFSTVGLLTKGMTFRLPARVVAINAASDWDARADGCFNVPDTHVLVILARSEEPCFVGDKSKPTVDFLVWGDSHAYASYAAFADVADERRLKGIFAAFPGCPPLINTVNRHMGKAQDCVPFYDAVAALVTRYDIKQIFFVTRWSLYVLGELVPGDSGYVRFADDWDREKNPERVFAESLDRTLASFTSVDIAILTEPPTQRATVTSTVAANSMLGYPASRLETQWTTLSDHLKRQASVDRIFETMRRKYPNVTLIDIAKPICDRGLCLPTRHELPLYWDDDHLNQNGARAIVKPLIEQFLDRSR